MTTYTYTSPESKRIITKMKAVIEEKQPILTRDLEISMGICSSSVTRFAGHLRREGIAHSIKVKGSHAVAWVMGRCPKLDDTAWRQAPKDGKPVVRKVSAKDVAATATMDPWTAALCGKTNNKTKGTPCG